MEKHGKYYENKTLTLFLVLGEFFKKLFNSVSRSYNDVSTTFKFSFHQQTEYLFKSWFERVLFLLIKKFSCFNGKNYKHQSLVALICKVNLDRFLSSHFAVIQTLRVFANNLNTFEFSIKNLSI